MKKKKWSPPYCDCCNPKIMGPLGIATARVVVNRKKGFTKHIFDVCAGCARGLKEKYERDAGNVVGIDFEHWEKFQKRLEEWNSSAVAARVRL